MADTTEIGSGAPFGVKDRTGAALKVRVAVVRMAHAADLPLPDYATSGAAGLDFLAAVADDIVVAPMQRVLVPTGLQIALPPGFELQIRPRSGLALRHGIMLPNSPGTIDEDYRGEIQIIVMNGGEQDFVIERGMRIAQGVLAPVVRIRWQEVTALNETARGDAGFGSTGHGQGGLESGLELDLAAEELFDDGDGGDIH